MKYLVVSYSYTGNNTQLAQEIAWGLGADLFKLEEEKPRNTKSIIIDMLFSRNPKLKSLPEEVERYDLVIFLGPIWMFHIPAPLRTCFRALKRRINKYAFISSCGGALGPNTKVQAELVKRLGKNLALYLELSAAQFCIAKGGTTMDDTSEYKLAENPQDLSALTEIALTAIRGIKGQCNQEKLAVNH